MPGVVLPPETTATPVLSKECGTRASAATNATSSRGGTTIDFETDDAFLHRLRSGDREAFRRLVDRLGPMVYTLILQLVSDRDLAEDLAQDVFVRAWGALPRFRGASSLSTWLYRIARNVAVNEMRSARRRRERREADGSSRNGQGDRGNPGGWSTPGVWGENPLASIEREEERRRLWGRVRELRPEQGAALTLYYAGGKTYREIGEILGMPIGTVKTTLHRAKEALRARLGNEETS